MEDQKEYVKDALEIGRIPTPFEIEQHKTNRGGWTKYDLSLWGVSWPPPTQG
jgi:hypothetical protein